VLALAAAVAGCSGGGSLPSAHSRSAATPPPASRDTPGPAAASRPSPRPLSVRVVLPARTMPGGSRMTGRVLVRNRTGHALHLAGCLELFQVALASRTYHPAVAWPLCLQRLTIPAGRSAYRLTVRASYSQCTQSPPQGNLLACLPGGRPPPLPPGVYRARLFQFRPLAVAPAPITVRVTAPEHTR
jgi:hypothetical protein